MELGCGIKCAYGQEVAVISGTTKEYRQVNALMVRTFDPPWHLHRYPRCRGRFGSSGMSGALMQQGPLGWNGGSKEALQGALANTITFAAFAY